jgi:uncharacterized membrane protein
MHRRIYVYEIMFTALILSMTTGSLLSENHRENAAQISLRVEPSTITIPPGSRGYAVAFITSNGGERRVSLKVVNPPVNVQFQLKPSEGKIAPFFTSILIIEVGLNVLEGAYNIQISASTNNEAASTNITLIVSSLKEDETSYTSSLLNRGETAGSFIIRVDPSNQVLKKPGEAVKYVVTVMSVGRFKEKVVLGVEGLPEGVAAILNPTEGRPDPVLRSNLQILVTQQVSPGLYTFTVYALRGENVQKTNATLKVESFNVTTVKRLKKELKVEVESDRLKYNPGEDVKIFGRVYAKGSFPSAKATVSIQVVDSEGKTVHFRLLETAIGGYFSDGFMIESKAQSGTYTVFATASAEGFKEGFARTVFTVASSSKPSIVVDSVYTTSVEGEEKEVFQPGESVVVWVLVNNSGANLTGGVVWVEVMSPLGVPLMVAAFGSNIGYMEQTVIWVQVRLNQDADPGLYEIKTLVSTGYISKGGKFIAGKEGAFLVSPS